MAIMVDVKPNLSAFREATVDDLATQLCDEMNRGDIDATVPYATCREVAEKMLERYWVVPK